MLTNNDLSETKEISLKRVVLDKALSQLSGINFIVSAITGTVTNCGKNRQTRPGVAYFVAYRKNSDTNELIFVLKENSVVM